MLGLLLPGKSGVWSRWKEAVLKAGSYGACFRA